MFTTGDMNAGKCLRCGFLNIATESACCRCGAELLTVPGKSPSFFDRVRDWFTKTGPKIQQRAQLRQILKEALADLTISDRELEQLNEVYEESDLSREEFSFVRDQIFTEFVDGLCSDRRISSEEESAIFSIADRLGFSKSALNNLTSNRPMC